MMTLHKKAMLFSVAIFLLVPKLSFAQIPVGQSFQKNPDQDSSKTYLQYLLYLPDQYYADETKKWPLVVFLHYIGAEGTNIDLVLKAALPKRLEKETELPFVVVSPQALLKQLWKPKLIKNFVEGICDRFQVDRNRIYLTGPSGGGSATWATAIEYPDMFAAIVPICGRSDPTNYDENAKKIGHIPIWAFHGEQDTIYPKEISIEMVNALQKAGANARLTLYPDLGHDCWDRVYSDPELYEWLLRQSR